MFQQRSLVLCVLHALLALLVRVEAHGRLWDPVGRSSMWRKGFRTPVEIKDNELYCGGFSHQKNLNSRCGVCGDPYDGPREHEAGGKYATGTIARTYTEGQQTTFEVELNANHLGYFEFKLCPTNHVHVAASEACLDQFPVEVLGSNDYRFYLPHHVTMLFRIPVVLPAGLHCSQCVLQWKYHTGHSWGYDEDGTGCLGCGPQEEFYGCADITILPSSPTGSVPSNSSEVAQSSPVQIVQDGDRLIAAPSNMVHEPEEELVPSCIGYEAENMVCHSLTEQLSHESCQVHCQVGRCPLNLCACVTAPFHTGPRPTGCRAAGIFAFKGYDNWCAANCARGNCPEGKCTCC